MNEFQLIPLTEKNQQYQPQQQQILDYAEYLGFNLPEDQSLLWIAREGLTSPLPEGWTALSNKQGQIFFKNETTGKIQVDHPLDQIFRQKYFLERKKKSIIKNKMEQISLVKINEQNESSISKTANSKYKQSPMNKNPSRSVDRIEQYKTGQTEINKIITEQSEMQSSHLIQQYNSRLKQIKAKYESENEIGGNQYAEFPIMKMESQKIIKEQENETILQFEIKNYLLKKFRIQKQLVKLELKFRAEKQRLINEYKKKEKNKQIKKQLSADKLIRNIQYRLLEKIKKNKMYDNF